MRSSFAAAVARSARPSVPTRYSPTNGRAKEYATDLLAVMRRLHSLESLRGRPFERAAAVRGYHRTPRTPAENALLLQELEGKLKDPVAVQRLSVLLSPSSARNLARAMNAMQEPASSNAAAAAAAVTTAKPSAARQHVAPITLQDLKFVALQQCLPFIGFGFVDNFLMILAGDYIDLTLGVSFGISSMAAAALGNTVSDIAGLGLGNVVEDMCARLGLPNPQLTAEQHMLPQTRFAKVAGSCGGVTIGCLLGMAPLLFIETREDQKQSGENSAPRSTEAVAEAT